MTILFILLLLALILSAAFIAASETALFSLSSMQVKAYSQDKTDVRKHLVASLVKRPADLLVTVLMLTTIANILIQNVISSMVGDMSGWWFNVGVPLAITLVFCEVIPKSIGISNNERFALFSAPFIRGAEKIFAPIRRMLTTATHAVVPWEFFFLRKEKQISTEELRHALQASHAGGILNSQEAELITGFLQLEESTLREVMRPRDEVLSYDLDDPIENLIHLFVDQEVSRIPICKNGLDEVIGIMEANIYFLHKRDIHSPQDLLPLVDKPFFVPETLPARTLLKQLYDKKEPLAMVVDEYGSVTGLIALEDLVEIVIGEISDRRDQKLQYTRSSEDVIIASGKLELSEIEEIFGVFLPSENNMVTVGGWLTEQIGDIPKIGTKLTSHDLFFHVLAADPNRVRRIYIRRLKPPQSKKKYD